MAKKPPFWQNIKRRDNSVSDTYIKNLLNELELENAKPALTPGTDTLKTKGIAEPMLNCARSTRDLLVNFCGCVMFGVVSCAR